MDITSASRESSTANVFVLSGGAARGAVQVGMLEALIEHGIVPHALVGTSVGALNAAFMGWRPDSARVRELRGKWLQMSTRDIFPGGTLARVGHLLRQRPYLFSSAALTRLIEDWQPVERLEDLPAPRARRHHAAGRRRRRLPPPRRPQRAAAGLRRRARPSSHRSSCPRAAAHPGRTSTAASPTSCRSAARPTWRPRGSSCSTPACPPACPADVRRSTCSSPAWASRCASAPGPTSVPA